MPFGQIWDLSFFLLSSEKAALEQCRRKCGLASLQQPRSDLAVLLLPTKGNRQLQWAKLHSRNSTHKRAVSSL